MAKLKLAPTSDPKTMTTEELWRIVHLTDTKDAAFEARCRAQLAARLQEDAQAGGDLRERVRRNLRMQKDAGPFRTGIGGLLDHRRRDLHPWVYSYLDAVCVGGGEIGEGK